MAKELCLPDSVPSRYKSYPISGPGRWLHLSDLHIPYHDKPTIELAVNEAKKQGCKGVLLNGDVMDCHWLSRHDKDPSAPRYNTEVAVTNKFLDYLNYHFPKAQKIFKAGNHEERLLAFIMRKAEELWGLEILTIPALLKLEERGIDWIDDRRVIRMNELNVIHGHEYPGGVFSPVNPARGLFLKAKSVALCGHHHQSSEHFETNINGTQLGAWSTGCACDLHPSYAPLNRWNHGFAIIELDNRTTFSVRNYRVLNGKIV